MDRRPLQLALREMHAATISRYTRIGMLLAVLLLTVSGPFGTFQSFNVGQRLAYWAVMVVACYLVGQGTATFCLEILKPSIAQKWPRVIVAGLLTALPVSGVVALVNGIAYQHFDAPEMLTLWLYTTIVTLTIVMVLSSIREIMGGMPATATSPDGTSAAEPAAPLPAPAPPPILERVPLPQRGKLLALLVEDHYVDILTDRGKTLVLMRLADAMRETAGVPGLQIHRSHWVARDAVVKAYRSDGKLSLELSNGMRLPVSRGYLAAVKEAGFIA